MQEILRVPVAAVPLSTCPSGPRSVTDPLTDFRAFPSPHVSLYCYCHTLTSKRPNLRIAFAATLSVCSLFLTHEKRFYRNSSEIICANRVFTWEGGTFCMGFPFTIVHHTVLDVRSHFGSWEGKFCVPHPGDMLNL